MKTGNVRQKGKAALKVLELLAGAAAETAELFLTIIESGYGASLATMERNRRMLRRGHALEDQRQRERQRFYELLSRLRRDGLIEIATKQENRVWQLTKRGLSKLVHLRAHYKKAPAWRRYAIERVNEIKIVIFDIPEQERWKRQWLRFELTQLGFTMIQKSVWVGNVKVSELFMSDLARLGLLPHVELFAITRTGSLKNLIRT